MFWVGLGWFARGFNIFVCYLGVMNESVLRGAPEEDVAWAFETVEDVSRTFALTISILEAPFSTWVCTGYLLCRVADTIEDANHIPAETQAELLLLYHDVLDAESDVSAEEFVEEASEWIPTVEESDGGVSADWRVVAEADRVVGIFECFEPRVQAAMRPVVLEMVAGMAMFIERYADEGGLRIQSIDELEEYCWYVAGTVGEMITNLVKVELDADSEALRTNEESFALLLQLVNIAKDVPDDFESENNVYLPSEWLADVGVGPEGVVAEENTSAVATVVSRVTERARGYTDGAYEYLAELPESETNVMEAFAVPYLLALGTIRELEANTQAAVAEFNGVKVSRAEVMTLLAEVQDGFTADELAELQSVIRSTPLHESTSS